MKDLKTRLAEHGFIANTDYDYPVKCLLSARLSHLRCLNIEGNGGRRKTAFAQALAKALDIEHVLYYEFPHTQPAPEPVRIPPNLQAQDADYPGEPPVEAFVQIVGEACALSEGEPTALILDQLQRAPFHRHLQISEFIQRCEWSVAEMQLRASRQNLHVFLIAEEPLYHSLQQLSFNLWLADQAQSGLHPTPAELGLNPAAEPVLGGLARLFAHLEVTPTWYEYQRLMHDIQFNIQSLDNLKTSIYGWIEGVQRASLYAAKTHEILEIELAPLLNRYLGTQLLDAPQSQHP